MKKLKYLLFILLFLFIPNVFAQDFNVTSTITSPTGSPTAGGYEGLEIYNSGSTNRYSVNTRYNGRLSRIRFNLPLPNNWPDDECFSTGDLLYTITLNMATNDWRNNFGSIFVSSSSTGTNWFSSFTYVSRQQIKINFRIPNSSTCYDFIYVDIKSRDISDIAITGETNWNLSSVILTANFSSGGSSGGSGSGSGSTSGATNQDIINNQNNNTQNIINNQDSNTQDIINNNNDNTQQIIENQNQNTQQQIDSQKVCSFKTIDKSFVVQNGFYLDSTGSLKPFATWGITDYINISSFELDILENTSGSASVCFYDSNKNLISCISNSQLSIGKFNAPTNTHFIRISINLNVNKPIIKVQTCKNGNQAISDSLTDNTDPSIDDSALNEVFGKVHFTDPLSYLLTLPTQLINQIVSMSDTCSAIDLGTLYGVHLTLPCINLENYLGSDLWNILDVILSVGLLSVILKNFYDTISNLLTLGGQKEAKEKFSMPTPMDFLATILGGDRQ